MKQKNSYNYQDLIDDVVHEIAHHVETEFIEEIYGDEKIKKEFLNKRKQLEFELRTEGLWTKEYDFENLKFDKNFDNFLYKRIGPNLLRMVTTGIFIRIVSEATTLSHKSDMVPEEFDTDRFEGGSGGRFFLSNLIILNEPEPLLFNPNIILVSLTFLRV